MALLKEKLIILHKSLGTHLLLIYLSCEFLTVQKPTCKSFMSWTEEAYHGRLHLQLLFHTTHTPPDWTCIRDRTQPAVQPLKATREARDTHVRLKGLRPPSHWSNITDTLIPAVVANRQAGEEQIDWRSERAGVCMPLGPARRLPSGRGSEREQLLLGGIWGEGDINGKNLEVIAYPLLPPICYDRMALIGRL